jgi:nucleoside-diphosphate-sugar epimerase
MPIVGPQWADVRDVARAHVLALSKKEVDGQRFLLYAGPYYNSDVSPVSYSVSIP